MRAFSGSAGLLREKYFNWSSQNHFLAFEGNISIFPREKFQLVFSKSLILTSEGRRSQQSRLSERSTFPGPGIGGH